MIRIALSHDIDRIDKAYQRYTHAVKYLLKGDIAKFSYHLFNLSRRNTYWGFDEIIKIETNFNVRSTFFFLNESIKFDLFKPSTYSLAKGRYSIFDNRIKDILLFLDNNGWEIGVHGSFQSFKNEQLLSREKDVLEQLVKHDIIGIRQHYLNLDSNTWIIQNACHFKYDSSYGYSDKIGFKDNRIRPFRPMENDFLVFPQVIMDSPFVHHPDRWTELEKIFDHAERDDCIIVVNWHNNYFNEYEFQGYKSSYIRLIEEGFKRNAIFKTIGEFYHEANQTK